MDHSYQERSSIGHNYTPRIAHQRPRPLDCNLSRPRTADGSTMSTTSWFQRAKALQASLASPDDDRFYGTRKSSGRSSSQHSRPRDSDSYQDIGASQTSPHQSTWDRFKKKTKLGSPKEPSRGFDNGIIVIGGRSRTSFSGAEQPSRLGKRNPNPGRSSIVPPKHDTMAAVQITTSRLSMSPSPAIEQHLERVISAEQRNRKGSVVNGGIVTTTTALLQQVDSAIDTRTIPSPQPVPNSSIGADVPWQQAKDRINYLEQELLQAKRQFEHAQHEMAQRDHEIARLKEELSAARQVLPPEAAAYEEQLAGQNALIERLRAKAADSAGMAVEAPLGQSRLQVTESRILEAWRELAFEVHNFARCYLSVKDLGTRKLEQWAKARGDTLEGISPSYDRIALDKTASVWFVEAAIWKVLHGAVFVSSTTHGNACWAGRYQSTLEKLSMALVSSIGPSEPDKTRHFHQWKATTASLIYTLGPEATDAQDTILGVTDKLEELIDPFKTRLSMAAVREILCKIATKAIAFDEILCGQQSWYYLCYPDPRHNFDLDSEWAEVPEKERVTGHKVKFVIRPSLTRRGGRRGEGSYAERQVVDKWLVWV